MASKLDEQDGRSSDIDMSELPGCLPSFLFSWPPQDDGDYQASFLRSELVARVRILFPSQSNTDCYNRMIGLAGPKSGPGDSEYEQPVRGAYHGTEIEGHGVFDRHHHVRVSDREWDNEIWPQRFPMTDFNLSLRCILFCLWLPRSIMSM